MATAFHNMDINDLVYQNQTLLAQKKESNVLLTALQEENEHLKRAMRLHLIAVRPEAVGSRAGQGTRPYDQRDLIISRLEAQVLTLTDVLATYQDRADTLQHKHRQKERLARQARLHKAGPTDLTVAWRPKKNELNDRTILLAKRAARRKARMAKENKQIENEQRDLLIEKYQSNITTKKNNSKSSRVEYQKRREQRIAELMLQEMEAQKQIELRAMEESGEVTWGNSPRRSPESPHYKK